MSPEPDARDTADKDPVRAALEVPLSDALFSRRSRRFGLGMSLPSGPLAHTSEHEALSLSELEEALLVALGTGITGLALGDLPPDGLSWMHRWIGRSWPCSVNSHSTELFFTNDAGLHVARLRGRTEPSAADALGGDQDLTAALLDWHRANVRTLAEGRADLPVGEPGLFAFNAWNANRPGTTLFIPVTDMTVEYLTLLFIYFDPVNRFSIVDELTGSRCGLERWHAAGRLDGPELSLVDLELRVLTTLNVEGAFICQNISLALQALGLGGWTFTGFLPHHLLGIVGDHRGLGFDAVTPEASPRHRPGPVPVGRVGVHQALCPPYVPDMAVAVERYLEERRPGAATALPYADPEPVMRGRGEPDDETVEIVTAFAQYVLDTYGRFPAYVDPMFVRLVVQAHHLDLGFYDAHYPPGAYTDLHRDHMETWHSGRA